MSYLAMSAAPFDNNNLTNNNENNITQKRISHSKTQKFRQNTDNDINPEKVNNILHSIHNNTVDQDDLGNYNPTDNASIAKHSDDFKPLNPYDFPSKPISMGSEKKSVEGMQNIDPNVAPQPLDNDDLNLQDLKGAFMNDSQVREYYRKLTPNYSQTNKNENNKKYYSSEHNTNYVSNNDNQLLIDKLNYMINLLEEQQEQKTSSVTEEVVLYSFLGVFIIFVIDSFTKVGKYVR